ncbi:hypothetical protein HXX76_009268 [Chlamydomonas incerta]|uniref:AAA+ ATPase domain-containing protein n=1 Tax=Chlamydomonas incerta TaxID=51695 RepID=A0A835VWB6_CHLIN|nr:hypothetical protein HXX76_009268 [Chlamydomonas incerta]|eukprot:KAG2431772.1 hypothetical protein HXX76_009268 [Chlamydomonas incerta]
MDDPQLQRAIYASIQTARAQGHSVVGARSGAGQATRGPGPLGPYRAGSGSYSPAARTYAGGSSSRGGGGGGGQGDSSYGLRARYGRIDSLRRDGIRPAATTAPAGGGGGCLMPSASAPSLGGSGSSRPLPQQAFQPYRPGSPQRTPSATATDAARALPAPRLQQHQQSLRRNQATTTPHSPPPGSHRANARQRGASGNQSNGAGASMSTAASRAVPAGSTTPSGAFMSSSGPNPVMEAIAAVTTSALSAAEAVALPGTLGRRRAPASRNAAAASAGGAEDAADSRSTGNGGRHGGAAAVPPAPFAAPVGGQGPPPRELVTVPAAGGGVVMVPAGVDPALAEAVLRDAVTWDTGVTFDDIAGCDVAKQLLHEAVALPLVIPEFFTGIREPWRGVLLHGPPGTGKTLLAKAVAGMVGGAFFSVSPSSLTSKWRGESEKLLATLFELARAHAPSIIFFDEIDAVGSARGSEGEHEASRRFKAELLQQMDGMCSGRGVMLLAATNCPWDLDPALRRRLEKRVLIGLPDAAARLALLRLHLRSVSLAADVDLAAVAAACEGLSGADIRLLCREAAMAPLRRQLAAPGSTSGTHAAACPAAPRPDARAAVAESDTAAQQSDTEAAEPPPLPPPPPPPRQLRSVADIRRLADSGALASGAVVAAADLAAARAALRPSVSPEQVAHYEAWDREFASA